MTFHPLDGLTRELTAFNSFTALCNAAGGYRPTILPRDTRHIDLADGYDAFQAERGDHRRAWRGIAGSSRATYEQDSPEGFLSMRFQGVPTGSGLAAQWLRVVWSINTAAKARGAGQIIGTPTSSYHPDGDTTRWVEEYPDFRVILRHTEWGSGQNSGTIECKHERAARWLQDAFTDVYYQSRQTCVWRNCNRPATTPVGSCARHAEDVRDFVRDNT